MLSKVKVLVSVLVISACLTTLVSALEPLKENRARISSLSGTLLLPDYTYLDIDMSFDCGSKYEDTAMIVTNLAGVQLLAAAYTHMWGEQAGEMVMAAWQNKVNKTDQRLPTFLIVSPAKGTNFDWRQSVKVVSPLSPSLKTTAQNSETDNTPDMPPIIPSCGLVPHN
ncbi:hypothetical protein [Aliikangiella sp. IMCC44359]|uniref:hypothetical protein n=1 Tax=Aliikangiella sp. IMCC44359 TaxID=3459125 RepID=UPI00403B0558